MLTGIASIDLESALARFQDYSRCCERCGPLRLGIGPSFTRKPPPEGAFYWWQAQVPVEPDLHQ
jgi:hypothetical protein